MTRGKSVRSGGEENFAEVVGSPGVNPRFVAFLRGIWPVLLFLFLAGYFVRASLPFPEIPQTIAGWLLVGCCIALAFTLVLREQRLSAYIKGAQGEERVARALQRLPADYTVFHGLLPDHSTCDVDHAVVGPNGVFVVETKNWTGEITLRDGKILCNGEAPTRDPLEQARAASDALQRHLERQMEGIGGAETRPVLCFAAGTLSLNGIQGVSGVLICSLSNLHEVLTERTETMLTNEQHIRIVSLLKQSSRR